MSRTDILDDEYTANPLRPYASRIFRCSVVGANSITRLLNGALPRDVWLQLVLEYVYFYIALTAACVAQQLSDSRRREAVEALITSLIPRIVDSIYDVQNEIQARGLKDRHVKMAIARVRVYDDYRKLLPNSERGLPGTGAGSLCATVAELIGQPNNPLYQSACFNYLAESFEVLRLKNIALNLK